MLRWDLGSGGRALADHRVNCPVVVDDPPEVSEEVNAFRVLADTGRSYFLDFIHYSPARLMAEVVCRLRVHEDALESIRDRLSVDLIEAPSEGLTIVWPEDVQVN